MGAKNILRKKGHRTNLSSRPLINVVWFPTGVIAPAAERPRYVKELIDG